MIQAMRITTNEMIKGLLLLWSYRVNLVLEAVAICGVFVGLNFLIGSGELPSDQLASTLLGYIIWLYTFMAVSNMSWGLREEVQTGTLEQIFLSPLPFPLLILGRALANFISTTASMVLIAIILVPLLGIDIPLRALGLVPFALTMIGLWGLGFMVGGATLIYKQVESLAYLAQYGVMFLNGALLPVDSFAPAVEVIAKLLPGTLGIIVLRRVTLDGASLLDVWHDGTLPLLILHSLASFVLGWVIFAASARYARWHGRLGQY